MIKSPKIIPPEVWFQVISLFYLGYSRDETATKLNLGSGTVSKYLDEFRKDIDNPTFEIIRTWGRFLRTHKITHDDAIAGIRISKLLGRYGIKEDNLNFIFEKISGITTDENETAELLVAANLLLEIKRKTGKSYQKTLSEYEKLSESIPVLENNRHDLESVIKRLCTEQEKALETHKTTKEELHQFTAIKSQFEKTGLRLADLPKYHTALKQIKRQGYDVAKILNYLQKIEYLEKQIEKSKKLFADYTNAISKSEKEFKSVSEKLVQLKLEYKKFLHAIKTVLEFRQNQQDPTTIIQWNKILHQNGLTVIQFDKKLRNYNSLLEYLRKLKEEILSYEQQKDTLQVSVANLRKEKQDITALISKAKIELEDKIAHVKKEIKHMEATNPLRLIYDTKGVLHNSLPMLVVFFEQLRIWCDAHKVRDRILLHAIDTLIERIKKC